MLRAAAGTQGQKAQRLGVSQPFVCALLGGKKVPGDEVRRRILAEYAVPLAAWGQPGTGATSTSGSPSLPPPPPGSTSTAAVSPPASQGVSEATPSGLPNPDGGRSVVERARELLAYLAVPGRTQIELAQAREIRSALTLEARLVGAMSTKQELCDHPDFGPWVEELVRMLGDIPGALERLERHLVSRAEPALRAA